MNINLKHKPSKDFKKDNKDSLHLLKKILINVYHKDIKKNFTYDKCIDLYKQAISFEVTQIQVNALLEVILKNNPLVPVNTFDYEDLCIYYNDNIAVPSHTKKELESFSKDDKKEATDIAKQIVNVPNITIQDTLGKREADKEKQKLEESLRVALSNKIGNTLIRCTITPKDGSPYVGRTSMVLNVYTGDSDSKPRVIAFNSTIHLPLSYVCHLANKKFLKNRILTPREFGDSNIRAQTVPVSNDNLYNAGSNVISVDEYCFEVFVKEPLSQEDLNRLKANYDRLLKENNN